MPKLTITIGENSNTSCNFETEVVMGRSPEADFLLNDLRSSRKHARVFKNEGEFYLEDMNSQNGTFLNGRRIKEMVKLKNNDNIRIGATWINFILDEESLTPGESFLGYKITQEVAKEANVNIYLATQTALQREVVLWILPRESFQQGIETLQQSFFKQISTVASLFHPNIMMLMDFAVTKRYFYCAFEEVDFNSNLKNYINKKVDSDQALQIAIQIASGLNYAHKQGVLHLHLTGKNILLQTSPAIRVLLTEFGVSRFLSESTAGDCHTTTGILGFSDYIAPEQVDASQPESAATDIYAFGCVLYHLLAGVPPFMAGSPTELAAQHLNQVAKSLKEIRPDLPGEMVSLVERCMQKDPAQRYASLEEVLELLHKMDAERQFQKIIHTDDGRKLIKKTLGEKVLLRWWLLLPIAAVLLGLFAFFSTPIILH